jgi:formamidopyrimidine-DNA glycosylase
MPELPEVEVTKQGVEPHVVGKTVTSVAIYDGRLRWPVPANLSKSWYDWCAQGCQSKG